jgi:hypothetical protein
VAIGLVALSVGATIDRRVTWVLAGFFAADTLGYWLLRRRALVRHMGHWIPGRLREPVQRPLAALYEGFQPCRPSTQAPEAGAEEGL